MATLVRSVRIDQEGRVVAYRDGPPHRDWLIFDLADDPLSYELSSDLEWVRMSEADRLALAATHEPTTPVTPTPDAERANLTERAKGGRLSPGEVQQALAILLEG